MRIRRFFAAARWPLLGLLAFLCQASARADLWVTGYYPGYEASQMAPSNIDFTTITHVIHFSLIPGTDGAIDSNANSLSAAACAKLVGSAHAAGRKALVCVGGAGTETDFLGATTARQPRHVCHQYHQVYVRQWLRRGGLGLGAV